MKTKLVIVESPSKSKTIEQYLGEEFIVLSSKGHIRDLAISGAGGLGLDIENNFAPKYVVIKEKKTVEFISQLFFKEYFNKAVIKKWVINIVFILS